MRVRAAEDPIENHAIENRKSRMDTSPNSPPPETIPAPPAPWIPPGIPVPPSTEPAMTAPMSRFRFVAPDGRGQSFAGVVDATSADDAGDRLRQAGYLPTSILEAGDTGTAPAPVPKVLPRTRVENTQGQFRSPPRAAGPQPPQPQAPPEQSPWKLVTIAAVAVVGVFILILVIFATQQNPAPTPVPSRTEGADSMKNFQDALRRARAATPLPTTIYAARTPAPAATNREVPISASNPILGKQQPVDDLLKQIESVAPRRPYDPPLPPSHPASSSSSKSSKSFSQNPLLQEIERVAPNPPVNK